MESMMQNGMIVVAGVVIVLGMISMFFVTNHLKKVDDIPSIKTNLENLVTEMAKMNENITKIMDKYVDLERRVAILEMRFEEHFEGKQ